MKKNLLSAIFSLIVMCGFTQLTVDNLQSPASIVEDVFLANGIFVSNVTFNGGDATVVNEQVGAFDGSNTNLGMTAGIIMATGNVNVAIGPNDETAATFPTLNGGLYDGTDSDLISLTPGLTINDWAILEFDFIATGDSLAFEYIFGSEEYLEYVNSSYNDHFAFFLSGPGIVGPYSNWAINIALIPGTFDPVSINTVNTGVNADYFQDNGDGMMEPFLSDNQYVQFDGLTVPMMACAGQLQVGEVYHIKLAIADASDAGFDSAVFLAGDSFVQFCDGTVNLQQLDDRGGSCMLSEVRAHVNYSEECGTVSFVNTSEVNIAYTDVHYEINGTETFDGEGTVTHTFDEPGLYDVKLVYGYNGFRAKYNLEPILISLIAPETPLFHATGAALTLDNYDGTSSIQWYLNDVAIEGAYTTELLATEDGMYAVEVNNGCPASSNVQQISIGINEMHDNKLRVYPNPSEGMFSIEYAGTNLNCSVYNALGQLILSEKFASRTQIKLEEAGVYTLLIRDGQNNILSTQKVIVK